MKWLRIFCDAIWFYRYPLAWPMTWRAAWALARELRTYR